LDEKKKPKDIKKLKQKKESESDEKKKSGSESESESESGSDEKKKQKDKKKLKQKKESESEKKIVKYQIDDCIYIKSFYQKMNQIENYLMTEYINLNNIFEYPSEWKKTNNDFDIIKVNENSSEFNRLEKLWDITANSYEIIKIERIQNKSLYKYFFIIY
jgi:hypothetical protein